MGAPSKLRLTFGDRLRQYRRAAHLTQEQLAERSGMSVRAISDLERGARQAPRRDTLQLLAAALGLSADEAAALEAAVVRLRGEGGGTSPDPTVSAGLPTADANQPPSPAAVASAAASPEHLPRPSPPSGTVTFLFTDIEGSTRLLQRLGGPRYAEVLGEHQCLLRAAFAAHNGHEVDTQGDSFFVAFPTALDALAAAADAARALAAHPWPVGGALRARMGLHSGAPQRVGEDYVGLDVHRAARIAAAGHGGQILLSAAAAELARHVLPQGITLRDLGAHRLKDLQQAERVYQAVLADVPNLPADFPPLKALDARPHNLPVQPSPILGRQREVEAISALLRREDVRLVTLTGPGGVGKTRLSLQVAAEALDTFPDGVWHVRLSRLTDPALVIPTIATTLDLKESGGTPLAEVLRGYLRDKHLLLVLDNFEQVVEAAPGAAELLESSPGVTALVTSRVRLHLRGEHEYALRPLALPDPAHLPPPERLSQYAALALFIERAQAAQADFAVTNATAPAVAAICARLDGLPLAIELAAARVKLLPPPALLKRLERALPVLTGGARDLDARQQTMRNTLAWSYDLLSPEEQRLFRRLAVFVGGCTLEAAEAVCAAPEGAEPLELDVLDGLSRLVDHSLIQQRTEEGEGGEARFGMLHVIREYALEQLETSGKAEELHQAHAGHFLAWAVDVGTELGRPGGLVPFEARLAQLQRDHNNLQAALHWARDRGETDPEAVTLGLRAATALGRYWWARGHFREGRECLEEMLLAAGLVTPSGAGVEARAAKIPKGVRAQALDEAGVGSLLLGDYAVARLRFEAALAAARAVGDRRMAAAALSDLGHVARRQQDLEQAAARFEESLALAQEAGDDSQRLPILLNLSKTAYYQGDLERAMAYFEAAARFRQVAGPGYEATTNELRGHLAIRAGDPALAATLGRRALAHWSSWSVSIGIADAFVLLAKAGAIAGDGERAARLLGAAASLRERFGLPTLAVERVDAERAVAPSRAALGEEAWQAAYEAGRALSLEEAIAEALGEVE